MDQQVKPAERRRSLSPSQKRIKAKLVVESSLIAMASIKVAFEIILVLEAIITNICMKGNAATGYDWR